MQGKTETPDPTPPEHDPNSEMALFTKAHDHINVAAYRINVLAADLERHLLSLNQNIRIRGAGTQATLSVEDLGVILSEVQLARDVLLGVLGSTDGAWDENDEKAKRVTGLLDELEAGGEFDGLSAEEVEAARRNIGLRLRADIG